MSEELVPEEKSYFIVNPAGAIHKVTREHAENVLKNPGYRPASTEEIQKLHDQGGNQIWNKPICKPWSPKNLPDQKIPFKPAPAKVEEPKGK